MGCGSFLLGDLFFRLRVGRWMRGRVIVLELDKYSYSLIGICAFLSLFVSLVLLGK